MTASHSHVAWIAATAVVVAMAAPAAWIPLSALSAARGERQFQRRLAEYRTTRRLIADHLSADGRSYFVPRFGVELREARNAARPGDIVRPEVADRIRTIVERYFAAHPLDRNAILSEVPHENVGVNGAYPADAPLATMPPLLLGEFPALPAELQYRFAGEDLILLDDGANVVVDVIPGVLKGNGR